MVLNQVFTLRDGHKIPAVGFGTWQAKPHEVENAVEVALRAGYRHIDCAAIYRNETEVGEGIRKSGVPRGDIFITSKLWNTRHRPDQVENALDKTLQDLGVDYLDLFLMHWPVAFRAGDNWFPTDKSGIFDLDREVKIEETWKAMVKLLVTGKVKSVGVSNFNIRRLKDLLSKTETVPVVNQVEAHPYLQQRELFDFCKENGILIEAYSPLGNNQTGELRTVDDANVKRIAKDLRRDGGQLLASWGVQRGTVVLPKSVTPARIKRNFEVFTLEDGIFEELNSLERHKRFNFPAHWGFDIFEEAGEASVRKAALKWAENNKS